MSSLKRTSPLRLVSACAGLVLATGLALPAVAGDQHDRDRELSGQVGRIYYDDSAYLGVGVEEEIEYPGGGARITYVVDDSPASRAGLRSGDVILRINGKRVHGPRSLTKQIEKADAGDDVDLLVARNGREIELNATLEERSRSRTFGLRGGDVAQWNEDWEEFGERWGEWGEKYGKELAERFNDQATGTWRVLPYEVAEGELADQMESLTDYLAELPNVTTITGNMFHCEEDDCETARYFHVGQRPTLGVHLVPTTSELREHLGGDRNRGVLISKVVEDSPAYEAGIEVGDLILAVNDEDVASTNQLRRALQDLHGETADVVVSRNGRERVFRVTFPEKKEVGFFRPKSSSNRFPQRLELERTEQGASRRAAEVREQARQLHAEVRERSADQRAAVLEQSLELQNELRQQSARERALVREVAHAERDAQRARREARGLATQSVREEQRRAREALQLQREAQRLELEERKRKLRGLVREQRGLGNPI